jgi:hypothetical protein
MKDSCGHRHLLSDAPDRHFELAGSRRVASAPTAATGARTGVISSKVLTTDDISMYSQVGKKGLAADRRLAHHVGGEGAYLYRAKFPAR